MNRELRLIRMIEVLKSDASLRAAFLKDPEKTLDAFGLDRTALNDASNAEGIKRAEEVLADASVQASDDAVSGLRKVNDAAARRFTNGFEADVEPFGVTLLERPSNPTALDITATAKVTCTFSPWDGCSADPPDA